MIKRIFFIIVILGLIFVGYRYLFPQSADNFVDNIQNMFDKEESETLTGDIVLEETALEDFEQDVQNLFDDIVENTEEDGMTEAPSKTTTGETQTGETLNDDMLAESIKIAIPQTTGATEEETTNEDKETENKDEDTTASTTVKTTTKTTTTTTTTISNGDTTNTSGDETNQETGETEDTAGGLSNQDMDDLKKLLDNVVE